MIILEFIPTIKQNLNFEIQKKLLAKIKKPIVKEKTLSENIGNDGESAWINKINFFEDGKPKKNLKGLVEPVRGYADIKTVKIVSIYKRFIPLLAKSLSQQNIFKKIITLLAIKYNFSYILPEWFELLFSTGQFLLKDEYYIQPVKELRRVLKGKINQNLLDAITLIFEYDDAYRFRLQDVIVELDKSKLDMLFTARKEIIRIFDILAERDTQGDGGQTNKWQKMKKMVNIVLWLRPKLLSQIIEILKDLNIEEMRMSKEDIYFSNRYVVYKCRGLDWETRKQENIKNYGRE
jgi:hypothetical protein